MDSIYEHLVDGSPKKKKVDIGIDCSSSVFPVPLSPRPRHAPEPEEKLPSPLPPFSLYSSLSPNGYPTPCPSPCPHEAHRSFSQGRSANLLPPLPGPNYVWSVPESSTHRGPVVPPESAEWQFRGNPPFPDTICITQLDPMDQGTDTNRLYVFVLAGLTKHEFESIDNYTKFFAPDVRQTPAVAGTRIRIGEGEEWGIRYIPAKFTCNCTSCSDKK